MFINYKMRRRSQKGFTLIELGIVIAVIAILATVVLMGRGFLESSRVSKVVEAVNAVAKGCAVYAGANGGVFPANTNLYTALDTRGLVPHNLTNVDFVQGFTISGLTASAGGNNQQWSVQIACNKLAASCQDLCTAKCKDGSLVSISNGGAANPPCACTATSPITLTFQL